MPASAKGDISCCFADAERHGRDDAMMPTLSPALADAFAMRRADCRAIISHGRDAGRPAADA